MPAYSLLEQYRGAGSPKGQASCQSQSGIPVIRVGVANNSRHRNAWRLYDLRPSQRLTGKHSIVETGMESIGLLYGTRATEGYRSEERRVGKEGRAVRM